MSNVLEVFNKFINDKVAWEMFITGQAGTGKTTELHDLVVECVAMGLDYQVCAHTHKACGILRSKLFPEAIVSTLHSFLNKRPTINIDANHVSHMESNAQSGTPERLDILFIDEWSMVGEKDLMDIRAMQDPEYEGDPVVKVVWIGDRNQLPPIKDKQTIEPYGDYWVSLTKIWRTGNDNPLREPIGQLVSFIEGAPAEPLVESNSFIRGIPDLAKSYNIHGGDKVILAFTNAKVQELNQLVEGRDRPERGDDLFSPNMHAVFTLTNILDKQTIVGIDLPFGDMLTLNSKYKTLEFLLSSNMCEFFQTENEEGLHEIYAVIFGTNNYKMALANAANNAAKSNKAIEVAHKVGNASNWAKMNPKSPLARKRAKAWRTYLTMKDCVVCLDFNHAMTIHKSQGSTYEHIFLDTNDLAMCMDKNYILYLKLFYVALSRASKTVTTN